MTLTPLNLASVLRKRTILSKLLALGALIGAGTLFSAAPAAASTGCSFSSGVATVELPANYDSAAIVRGGKAILVNGASCASATVDNTTQIVVNGAGGKQFVTIDLSGGPFAGPSEIEFCSSSRPKTTTSRSRELPATTQSRPARMEST